MTSVRSSIDPLSVALVVGCAAWFVPQRYLGPFHGLFPDLLQIAISLLITIGSCAWALRVATTALANRIFPWAQVTLLVVSFAGMELIWRRFIMSLPDGDFKVGWVTMLYAQPVLAGVSILILARSWRDFWMEH